MVGYLKLDNLINVDRCPHFCKTKMTGDRTMYTQIPTGYPLCPDIVLKSQKDANNI